jgi:hypothetical protein
MFRLKSERALLTRQVQAFVGSTLFARGRTYFNQGRVQTLTVATDASNKKIRLSGKIKGTHTYTVGFSFHLTSHQFGKRECNCPYGLDYGKCKHLAALGLAFVDALDRFAQDLHDDALLFADTETFVSEFTAFLRDDGLTPAPKPARGGIATRKKVNLVRAVDARPTKTDRSRGLLQKFFESVGIDFDAVDQKTRDELASTLRSIQPQSSSKSKKSWQKTPEKVFVPQDLTAKYYILFQTGERLRPRIHTVDRPRYAASDEYDYPVYPDTILQAERRHLTDAQRDLMVFLREHSFYSDAGDEFPYTELFDHLEAAGFPIFFESYRPENRLTVHPSPDPIRAEFLTITRSTQRYRDTIEHTDFLFRLFGSYYDPKQAIHAGCDSQHLFVIRKGHIERHPISPLLFPVVNQILANGQMTAFEARYNKRVVFNPKTYVWQAVFHEHLIPVLSRFLTDARNCFTLENNFPETFEASEQSKPAKKFVVDYDSVNHTLRTQAVLDYGFTRVDIAHVTSLATSTGRLQPKPFDNRGAFHFAIDNGGVRYAPITWKNELGFFKEVYTASEQLGFNKQLRSVRTGAKAIADYHRDHWPHLEQLGYPIEFVRDRLDFVEASFRADINADMDAATDWLAFDIDCYCGDNRVTLDMLRHYVENKEAFLKTEDGRLLRIANPEALERFILLLESFHRNANGSFEGRAYHAPELENIFTGSPHYTARFTKGFSKFLKEAHAGRPVEKVPLPKTIEATLRDYQKDGVYWMHFLRKYRFAGILADDMGLGKTLQALTLIHAQRVTGQPSLVLCPKTLLFNWEQEANKFFPDLKTLVIEGAPEQRKSLIKHVKKYDLVVTSYPTVKKDFELYQKSRIVFHYCLLDEAQSVKNHRTQNAQIVKQIPAEYRIALTGTPLENSVSEMWSVFEFLMPGFLGTHADFVKRFQTPIMKGNDARALAELRHKIAPFMLRRTKEKVLKELPAKVFQTIVCELEEDQNILYQEILANVKREIFETVKTKGFAQSQIHILAGLTKLRQVCNHPNLLLKHKDFTKYQSAKLSSFEELIDEIVSSGRKVLVFSQFTTMLDILSVTLDKQKIKHLTLTGKTNNRKALVEQFNTDPAVQVFLISLKAGGTGLNLVAADNVIIFDPWWNPSVENQAIDRAHRIGQKKSVNVYRLITKGTIEERILALQDKKRFLFDNLVSDNASLFKTLTWNDIKDLFQ